MTLTFLVEQVQWHFEGHFLAKTTFYTIKVLLYVGESMSFMIFIPIKSIFIPVKWHVKHLVSLGGGSAFKSTLKS